MTYDGALVMPRNCVAMQEDDMMYTEGGLTKNEFLGNVTWLASGIVLGYYVTNISVFVAHMSAIASAFSGAYAAVLATCATLNPVLIAVGVGILLGTTYAVVQYGRGKWW